MDAVLHQLLLWYREWKPTGTVAYRGREDKIVKYPREVQAGMLAEILNKVVVKKQDLRAMRRGED